MAVPLSAAPLWKAVAFIEDMTQLPAGTLALAPHIRALAELRSTGTRALHAHVSEGKECRGRGGAASVPICLAPAHQSAPEGHHAQIRQSVALRHICAHST